MFGSLNYLEPTKKKVHVNNTKKPQFQNQKAQNSQNNKSQQNSNKKKPENKFQQKQQQKNNKINDEIESAEKHLKGSKFRMLNEFLYTENSQKAFEHFSKNTEDFEAYHSGFRSQAEQWPVKPVDVIIEELETNEYYKDGVICDLGCGDGFIYEHFRNENRLKNLKIFKLKPQQNPEKNTLQKIHSFDLVSHKKFITQADISNLPIESNSANACIFCLALMGTNYINFLLEATRVLKNQGRIIIAEVKSRITSVDLFCSILKLLGFHVIKSVKIDSNQKQQQGEDFFYTIIVEKKQQLKFEKKGNTPLTQFNANLVEKAKRLGEKSPLYKKGQQIKTLQDLSALALKPCIHKRR